MLFDEKNDAQVGEPGAGRSRPADPPRRIPLAFRISAT
jgi:hypothetical protein